jgi:hypothetical protein
MGLYKGQNIIADSYMLPRADDIGQVNVSRKRRHKKRETRKRNRSRKEEENKEAGNTKNICQRSISLPRLRLGGL